MREYQFGMVVNGVPYTIEYSGTYTTALREFLNDVMQSLSQTGHSWIHELFHGELVEGSDSDSVIGIGNYDVLHGEVLPLLKQALLPFARVELEERLPDVVDAMNRRIRDGLSLSSGGFVGPTDEFLVRVNSNERPESGNPRGSSAGYVNYFSNFDGVLFGADDFSIGRRVEEYLNRDTTAVAIEAILRESQRSRIVTRIRDRHGTKDVVLDTFRGVQKYFSELNCFWLAVELFYGTSPLMQHIRSGIGETNTPGHTWLKERLGGEQFTLQLPSRCYQSQKNENSLVRDALIAIGSNKTYFDRVSLEDIVTYSDWCGIAIVMIASEKIRNIHTVLERRDMAMHNLQKYVETYKDNDASDNVAENESGILDASLRGSLLIYKHGERIRENRSSVFPLSFSAVYSEVKHVEPVFFRDRYGSQFLRCIAAANIIDTGKLAINGRSSGQGIADYLARKGTVYTVRTPRTRKYVQSSNLSITPKRLATFATERNLERPGKETAISNFPGLLSWMEEWIECLGQLCNRLQSIVSNGLVEGHVVEKLVKKRVTEFLKEFPFRVNINPCVLTDRDALDMVEHGGKFTLTLSDILGFLFARCRDCGVVNLAVESASLIPVSSGITRVLQTEKAREKRQIMDLRPVNASAQRVVLEIHVSGVGPTHGRHRVCSLQVRKCEGSLLSKVFRLPGNVFSNALDKEIEMIAKKDGASLPCTEVIKGRILDKMDAVLEKQNGLFTLFHFWKDGNRRILDNIDTVFAHTENAELSHGFVWNRQISEHPISVCQEYDKVVRYVNYTGDVAEWAGVEDGVEVCEPLTEIDFVAHYPMCDMGAYNGFVKSDPFGHRPVFGGSYKPSFRRLEREYPLMSYVADFGKVWFSSKLCNWEQLDALIPGRRLSKFSSFGMLYNEKRMVNTSHVIQFCQEICDLKGIDSAFEDRKAMFTHIQFDVLGLKEGMFEWPETDQRMLHLQFRGMKSNSLEKTHLGGQLKSWLGKKLVLSEKPWVAIAPRRQDGAVFPGEDMDLVKRCRGSTLALEKQLVIAEVVKLLGDCTERYDGFRIWGGEPKQVSIYDILKNDYRRSIGKAKFIPGKGGVRLLQETRVLYAPRGAIGHGPSTRKRIRLSGAVNNSELHYCNWDGVGGHFLMQDRLHALPDYSLMSVGCMFADAQVNGIGEWRNSILCISSAVMDAICMRFPIVHVKTDSVLVRVSEKENVKAFLDAHYKVPVNEHQPVQIMIPGHTPLYRTIDHTFKKSEMSEQTGKLLSNIIRGKGVENSVNEEGFSFGERPEIEYMLSKLRKGWSVTRESDWLKEFAEIEPVIQGAPPLGRVSVCDYFQYSNEEWKGLSGKELHRMCRRLCNDNGVWDDFYLRYSRWAASRLIGMQGALMIGEPGAGKSHRVREMLSQGIEEEGWGGEVEDVEDTLEIQKRKSQAFLAPMHSILRDFREFEEDVHVATVDSFLCTGYNMSSLARRARRHLKAAMRTVGKHLESTDVIFVDEIETTREEAIRFFGELYEKGTVFYFVGDPYQTLPCFGKGMDLECDEVRRLCNGNKHVFDLQYRSSCEVQNDILDSILENGTVSSYLKPEMGWYGAGMLNTVDDICTDEQVFHLDSVLQQMTNAIVQRGDPEYTIGFQNYKIMGLVWAEVNRRIMSNSIFSDNEDWTVLVRTGNSRQGDQIFDISGEASPEALVAPVKTYWERWSKQVDLGPGGKVSNGANGPAARNFLTGIDLVMIPGCSYVPTEGFVSQVFSSDKHRFFQQTRYIYRGSQEFEFLGYTSEKARSQGQAVCGLRMPCYRMEEQGTGKVLWCSEAEICMFFIPSWLVLHSFVVGATLDRFLLLNCHYGVPGYYESIESQLARDERQLGKYAVYTNNSRMLRVARTRVRDPSCSEVLDLRIPGKTFWKTYYFGQGATNFGHCEVSFLEGQESSHGALYESQLRRVRKMHTVIGMGHLKLRESSRDSHRRLPWYHVDQLCRSANTSRIAEELLANTRSFPTGESFLERKVDLGSDTDGESIATTVVELLSDTEWQL